jgi:cysteine desulfurase
LERAVNSERIYLDYAATTPLGEQAVAAMRDALADSAYNPSSLHAEGRRSRALLDRTRDRVAALLGAARKEITFTASGSESDTLALFGVARAHGSGGHILSSVIEHHAVLHALDALRDDGYEITLLPVDRAGLVDVATFAAAIRPDTFLTSIMYANNEIGTVQPIGQLAAVAREHGVLFHTDAVQAPQWLPIDVEALGVDLLSISAHKFYGPKGVGLLYVRDGVPVEPLVYGGGQEFGRRSGTENIYGLAGMATALERAVDGRAERVARIGALRDRLEGGIRSALDGVRFNGAGAPRLANNSNASFLGVDSEALLMRLDLEGIAVSSGSACTSGSLEPSHVIAALGDDPEWQRGVIRFSLGAETTPAQIDRVVDRLVEIVRDLRKHSG